MTVTGRNWVQYQASARMCHGVRFSLTSASF